MQMILRGGEYGGHRLLQGTTLAEMVRDQLEGITVREQPEARPEVSAAFPIGAGTDGFGLGFQVSRSTDPGQRPPGSLSWAGIENTHFWIDLENGLGVVLLMQQYPFYDPQAVGVVVDFEQVLYDVAGG